MEGYQNIYDLKQQTKTNSTGKVVCPESSTVWPGNHFRNQLAHHHPILTIENTSHMGKWHVQDFTNNWWQSQNYRSSLMNQIRAVSLLKHAWMWSHHDWVLQVESPSFSFSNQYPGLQQCLYLLIWKELFLSEFQKAASKNKKEGVALKNRTVSKGARCLFEWLMDNLEHLIEVSIYNNYVCRHKLLWRKEEVVWVKYFLNLRPEKSQWVLWFLPLLLPHG